MRETGRFVASTTSGESIQAFVPFPLPPDPPLVISDETAKLLNEAINSIEKLRIASQMVPSKEWLLYGFVRKEAVITSQIEGTQSTLIDLLSSDENQSEHQDLEEVCNYIKALDYAWEQVTREDGLPLSLRLIKQIHKILLNGARGKNKNPGMFRASQNWIGGTKPSKAVFVPPPPKEMNECLNTFEKYLHENSNINPLINIGLIHVQFESIHPFLDGNGRIGRLLISLLLRNYGFLDSPLLYLSLFFKTHREDYYTLLNKVRTQGAWEEWIDFFLEGIIHVSKDVVTTSEKLQSLTNKNRILILESPNATIASIKLLDELPKKPIINLNQAVEKLGLTKPPANKALKILVDCGILVEVTGKKKDRQYRYQDYLNILAKDTEL